MIFEQYSEKFRNDSHENKHGSTAKEFVDVVECWLNHRPYDLWKYWGKLTVRDRTAKEIRRMFAIWSSMLERKAGRPKFRIVAGAEIVGARSLNFHRVCSVDFYVFIGGVVPGKDFQQTWMDQWLDLGGSRARLQEFDWLTVQAYLKNFSPGRRFEIEVKLPAGPRMIQR